MRGKRNKPINKIQGANGGFKNDSKIIKRWAEYFTKMYTRLDLP